MIGCMLAGLCLIGCTTATGSIPDKKAVMKAIHHECPTEVVKMVGIDKEGTAPKRWTYHVQSTERDLEFTAVSTLQQESIDGGYLPIYTPKVFVDYIKTVKSLYEPDMRAKLESSPFYCSYSSMVITSYDQIEEVCRELYEISSVFEPERNYNDEAWMKSNAPLSIKIYFDPNGIGEKYDDSWIQVSILAMNGCQSYDTYYDKVTKDYAQKVTDRLIVDADGVPTDLLGSTHKSMLPYIYVSGVLFTSEMANSPKGSGHYNRTDRAAQAFYDYDFGEYVVMLDACTVSEECDPHPLESYIQLAGGFPDMDYNKGHAEWEINDDRFELKATELGRDTIDEFVVTKNGENLNIRYHNFYDSQEIGIAYYMITVPVSDLARMLNMEVEVNEDAEIISFYNI